MIKLTEIQEIMLAKEGELPFKNGQGEMYELVQNYKNAPVGTFNQDEIKDLEYLNDKENSGIELLAEDGTVMPKGKAVWDLGRCAVGLHNKTKHKIRNGLKATQLKIIKVLYDTIEEIITKFPAGNIKPGEVVEIEVDYKPSVNRRKGLRCATMIIGEPQWSKRMEWAVYKDEDFEN